MVVRKNASQLTSHEIETFVAALKELKRSGRYDVYVLQHAQAVMSNIHRCSAFLPWHRQLLVDLEKELQEVSGDPNLAIPYWHWGENATFTNPEDYRMWADDFLGPGGKSFDGHIVTSGPFRAGEWDTIDINGNNAGPLIRSLGNSPIAGSLPTQEQIEAMLRVTPFDVASYDRLVTSGFRNLLEGWYGSDEPMFHNRGHVWVGGSMIPMTSPNDPVFFLHHCFVDKLWWDWQKRHSHMGMEEYLPTNDGRPSQNLHDQMEAGISGNVTPAQMLDIEALGYSYDTQEPFLVTDIQFSADAPVGELPGHEGHGNHGDHGGNTGDDNTGGGDDGDTNTGNTGGGHDDHSGHDTNDTNNTGNDHGNSGHTEPGNVDSGGNDHSGHDDHGGGSTIAGTESTGTEHSDHGNSNTGTTGSDHSNHGNTSTGTTSSARGRGKGCMVMLAALLMILFSFACKAGMKNSKATSYELYPNKEIGTSAYWYFDIAPGKNDVYKIMTTAEDIYIEVPSGATSFSFEDAQLTTAKVKVVTKKNECFLGDKGKISGVLKNNELELNLDFDSITAKSNAKGEMIIKDRYDKERHTVKVQGTVRKI